MYTCIIKKIKANDNCNYVQKLTVSKTSIMVLVYVSVCLLLIFQTTELVNGDLNKYYAALDK